MQTFFENIVTIFVIVGFLAFIVFAFRQGFQVRPRGGDNSAGDAAALSSDNHMHGGHSL